MCSMWLTLWLPGRESRCRICSPEEAIPEVAKNDITPCRPRDSSPRLRPRDIAGKTRHRIAVEHLADLVALDKIIKSSTKELQPWSSPAARP